MAPSYALERFKFAVYVLVPVLAVVLYNQPIVYETSLKAHRYVVYQRHAPEPPLLGARRAPRAAAPAAEARA